MKIKDWDALVCPKCGFDYLHQIEAKCTWRNNDDADGTCFSSSRTKQSIEKLDAKDIRRDNLVIEFYCEGCLKNVDLMIYQHKGQTFMDWLT